MYPKILNQDYIKTHWSDTSALKKDASVSTYMHYNYEHGMHSHAFYEINIIFKGEGKHYISDSSLDAQIGDVFVIPPNVKHGYYSKKTLDIYHILIKKDFICAYEKKLNLIKGYNMLFDIEPLLRSSSVATDNLKLDSSELDSLYKELKYINLAGENDDFTLQNILTLALIAKLSDIFYRKVTNRKTENRENSDLLKVMSYIKNNLDRKLSVDILANHINTSPATLNRRFKTVLQKSPAEYILECRIARAKELIEQKNHTKAEISQICGFYDTSHLNKYLK